MGYLGAGGQPGYPDASPSPLGTPDPKMYAGGPGGQPLPMYALGGAPAGTAPQTGTAPTTGNSGISSPWILGGQLIPGDPGTPRSGWVNARNDITHTLPVGIGAAGTMGLSLVGPATADQGPNSLNIPGGGTGTGTGLPTDLLGLAGGISQQNAYQNQADWARNVGQPYRDTLQGTYANPMGYLGSPEVTGAVQQGTDALSRSLSTGGNPVGNGGALQQLQNYSTNQQLDRLAQYRQQLGGFGGLNAINQSIPGTANAAIGARGNTWQAGGSLLTDIFGRGGVGGNIFGNVTGGGSSLPTNPTGGGQVDFGNDPTLGYGYPSQFDPSIDWSNLYG